mmetsp:Transcript_93217/g.268378  ORF Transcript_93217/g.268378 Transcript_93217/m.268378 type:complete len:255 (+) Transcript_93217:524-1288(+)
MGQHCVDVLEPPNGCVGVARGAFEGTGHLHAVIAGGSLFLRRAAVPADGRAAGVAGLPGRIRPGQHHRRRWPWQYFAGVELERSREHAAIACGASFESLAGDCVHGHVQLVVAGRGLVCSRSKPEPDHAPVIPWGLHRLLLRPRPLAARRRRGVPHLDRTSAALCAVGIWVLAVQGALPVAARGSRGGPRVPRALDTSRCDRARLALLGFARVGPPVGPRAVPRPSRDGGGVEGTEHPPHGVRLEQVWQQHELL